MKRNQKGFTLVEIIIVLIILAILAAIAVPAMMKYINDAKEKQLLAKMRSIYIAAQTVLAKAYANDTPENEFFYTNGGLRQAITDKSGYQLNSSSSYWEQLKALEPAVNDATKEGFMKFVVYGNYKDGIVGVDYIYAAIVNDNWRIYTQYKFEPGVGMKEYEYTG